MANGEYFMEENPTNDEAEEDEIYSSSPDDDFDYIIVDEEEVQGVLYKETINATPELSKNFRPTHERTAREKKVKRSDVFQQNLNLQELESVEEEWIPTDEPFGAPPATEPKIFTEEGEIIKVLPGGSYLVVEKKENFSQIFLKNLIVGSAVAIPFGVAALLLYIFIGPKF